MPYRRRSLIQESRYLVQDNLNTHTADALCWSIPRTQPRSILDRLEFPPDPRAWQLHGSWLNHAEIESSVFERGCLSRPVPDMATLQRRVHALEAECNECRATIEWQFTVRQTHVKFHKPYPIVYERLD
jgi:hypothetical protein